MMILAHSMTTKTHRREHAIVFEFEGRQFECLVVQEPDAIYVAECFYLKKKEMIEIDIPAYFGSGFAPAVYEMLYKRAEEKDE